MFKLDVEIVEPDLARQFDFLARGAIRETIIVNPADARK